MTVSAQTDPDFAFAGLETPAKPVHAAAARAADPLGALAALEGTWKGHGFNAIWRPHHPAAQDRFLELACPDASGAAGRHGVCATASDECSSPLADVTGSGRSERRHFLLVWREPKKW